MRHVICYVQLESKSCSVWDLLSVSVKVRKLDFTIKTDVKPPPVLLYFIFQTSVQSVILFFCWSCNFISFFFKRHNLKSTTYFSPAESRLCACHLRKMDFVCFIFPSTFPNNIFSKGTNIRFVKINVCWRVRASLQSTHFTLGFRRVESLLFHFFNEQGPS